MLKGFLENEKYKGLIQFVKFGLVGVSNTAISYGLYLLFVLWGMHYEVANFVSFSISVVNAFYWNNKYVFKVQSEDEVRPKWWIMFIKTYISYAGTGLLLTGILLALFVERMNINEKLAPIISLIITVPSNYFLNKLWAFKSKRKQDSQDE